jgi:uncharacterized protein YbaA (DUF1428 family)
MKSVVEARGPSGGFMRYVDSSVLPVRDRVNAKVMKDKRLAGTMVPNAMPFDVKRMVYGGFRTIVDL